MTEVQVLKNRVECYNKVAECINAIQYKLQGLCREAGKVLQTNTLPKKQRDAARAICEDARAVHELHFAFVRITDYTISLEVSAHYLTSENTCAYITRTAYLADIQGLNITRIYDLQDIPLATLDGTIKAMDDIAHIEQQIKKLSAQKDAIRRSNMVLYYN
jgi:hypothetical protein